MKRAIFLSSLLIAAGPILGQTQGSAQHLSNTPGPVPNTIGVREMRAASPIALATDNRPKAQEQSLQGLPLWDLGFEGNYALARGAFAQNADHAWGAGGHAIRYTSPGSPLGIRMDFSWLRYGSREQAFPLYWWNNTLIETTSNDIYALTIGPQFAINYGPFRPYINVAGGVSYFTTTSSFSLRDNLGGNEPYLPSGWQPSDDWKLNYNGGAGVNIPITVGPTQIMLDLGAKYFVNGRTTYLASGDVSRDPSTGRPYVNPRRTDVHYLSYHIGLSFTFPGFKSSSTTVQQ